MKKSRFKVNESGYHRFAVKELATWVNGMTEQPFYIDGSIAFVPDVTCKENGVITRLYEVIHTHPVNGKKLGMMQYWCYYNNTELIVFEVSADFILRQVKRPYRIETMETYNINQLTNN